MRVLGVGQDCDLGAMYQRLAAQGNEVRVHIADAQSSGLFEGMLERTHDYRDELSWIREAGTEGIIVFEGTGWGAAQDALRAEGFQVVGGSALGDRLESDRVFGQSMLAECGMRVARTQHCQGFEEALNWLREHPRRCVLKFDGAGMASTRTYVGQLEDGSDVVAVLSLSAKRWSGDPPSLVLMDHVEGVEVGVGAYFNGNEFMSPPNLDWEHKHFFPGDLGELTGEMGTLASYEGGAALFSASLAKLEPHLRASGYCGYINLNMIANAQGLWPLELTCRFGYPGFALLDALQVDPWDKVLSSVVAKEHTLRTLPGFAVGVVLTVPPFPYRDGYDRLSKGMPICFRRPLLEHELARIHLGEVALEDGVLVTAGVIGYAAVVTGCGESVQQAQEEAYALAHQVVIPNIRYRHDIGQRFVRADREALTGWGWLARP